ncbi:MAG: UDP-N-acetylmuramate dehydrogenase, partial [Luteibaculum sp.]
MKFLQNHPLKNYNTFGIQVKAKEFFAANNKEELQLAVRAAQKMGSELRILGGGSNILFTQDFPHILIQPTFKDVKKLREDDKHVWIEVEAGKNWHSWVLESLDMNCYGLENLSLIPGNVGAAPIQNIGAYGVEAEQFIEEVNFFEFSTGNFKTLPKEECDFGYRNSVFKHTLKNQVCICSVTFKLLKKPELQTHYGAIEAELERLEIKNPGPKDVSHAVINIRQSKLPNPAELGNAGSFFKNPVVENSLAQSLKEKFPDIPQYSAGEGHTKIAAGWLIEKAGWK